jgi:hypothetical protein
MTASLLRTRTLSDTDVLDRCLYTSTYRLLITPRIPGPGKPDLNRFHGCKLLSAGRLSISHCTRQHPCTVTAAHHPHTRPPDIPARLAYQRSLVNTYLTSDLCRQRALDNVQNVSERDGRVAGIPPCPRSSTSDILQMMMPFICSFRNKNDTSCPPNIGPRAGGVQDSQLLYFLVVVAP